MIWFFVVFVYFSKTMAAEVGLVQYQAIKPRQFYYSFAESCKVQRLREVPLITAHSLFQIDCMGKLVDAQAVCLKKGEELEERLKLLRAFVRAEKKDVVCEYGEGAELNLVCQGSYLPLCKDPKKSCLELKAKYSAEVPLWKATVSEKTRSSAPELNCYFSVTENLVK
ncbi:MAG: hypothetical protein A2X86_17310 [Bdellovibrionales bacterium GWA2_49_15]|nr:MAG: hypothetical protein A2X86_17310 [Bdellovibrionales bacterium GWA2_49_15]HAZ14002.1 hypothetical protein [Bdellovibrionales bacterium]